MPCVKLIHLVRNGVQYTVRSSTVFGVEASTDVGIGICELCLTVKKAYQLHRKVSASCVSVASQGVCFTCVS
jgi:hypothetical protein